MVKVNGFTQTKNENKNCYFYVGGSESTGFRPTLIRENIPYLRTFNKKNYKGFFNLPFPYVKGNLNIKINMFNSNFMNYSIYINDVFVEKGDFISSILIQIKENNLKVCDKINGCAITIILELIDKDKNPEVPIELIVSSDRKQPLILPKGVLRRTGINNNSTDYYYIEVEKDEEGEIILDFKRGNGFMFGTLIEKPNKYDKNWRKNIKLPNSDNKEQFYDPIIQKIKYKGDAKKCSNGCILIIGVESKDNKKAKSLLTSEYTIFARYITNYTNKTDISSFAVNIPVNEYIVGSLSKNSAQGLLDSYIYQINDDVHDIEIEFKSKNATLYYSVNENNILKIINSTFSIDCKNNYVKKVLNITKKVQTKQSLKLVVKSDNVGKNRVQYLFRVNPIYGSNNNLKLVEINSDKPVLCDSKNKEYCYYYLPIINSYVKNKDKLILYAAVNLDNEIYVKFVDQNKIKNIKDNGIWPTKDKYDIQSGKEKYIKIDFKNETISKSNIILISLYNHVDTPITFYSVFKSKAESISPNPNSLQLVYLEPNEAKNIDISHFSKYLKHINITKIKGNRKIKCDENEIKANETTSTIKCEKNISIKSKSDDFILKIEYILDDSVIPKPDDKGSNQNGTNPNKTSENKDKKNGGKSNNTKFWIIGLSILLGVIIIAVTIYLCYNCKKNNKNFDNNVAQLSLTLSTGAINNPQKEPLVGEKNEL